MLLQSIETQGNAGNNTQRFSDTHFFLKYVSFISLRRFWLLQMCECDKYFQTYFHTLETRGRNRRQRITKSGIYLFCSVKLREKKVSPHVTHIVTTR